MFIQAPIIGCITPPSKFDVPVKNANIVPSILRGVIFAKSAIIGKVENAIETVPKTTFVKKRNARSLIPQERFHLIAKAYAKKAPKIPMQTLKNRMVLTSTLFKNFSYIITPTTEQTYPTRVIIANINLLTPTTFIKKK